MMIRERIRGSAANREVRRCRLGAREIRLKVGVNNSWKVFSPTAPNARLTMVMPSWQAAIKRSRDDGFSSQPLTILAAGLPSSASNSIRALRDATAANSTLVKNAFSAIRSRISRKFHTNMFTSIRATILSHLMLS